MDPNKNHHVFGSKYPIRGTVYPSFHILRNTLPLTNSINRKSTQTSPVEEKNGKLYVPPEQPPQMPNQPEVKRTTSYVFGTPSLLGISIESIPTSTFASTATVFGETNFMNCTDNFSRLAYNCKRKRRQQKPPDKIAIPVPASTETTLIPAAETTSIPYSTITPESAYEEKLAFCCYVCRCHPLVASAELCSEICDSSTEPGDYLPFYVHRRCCHDNQSNVEGVRAAIERTLKSKRETERIVIHKSVLEQKLGQAKKLESQLYSEMQDVDPVLVLHTSGKTAENIKFFNNVKEKNTKKPIVLLELFAGIGGGIVALKNIGVAIRAVVTVEHDPAAFFVYKSNHYDKNDRITFIHKEKFEDLSLDEILLSLGPIDFVIGGPPCVDFSGVNATRQGIEGFQGSYMMKFASLVHDLKNHTLQNQNPLFFLCENVPISMDCGLLEIEEKFQVVGVTLDAKYLSPCKRNRMYFTNIPLENADWDLHDRFPANSAFLGDGWMHPAEAYDPHCNPEGLKANTFMASAGRIDDDRMLKVRQYKNLFEVETFSIGDRERMLGLPIGYVEAPVEKLFATLEKCFSEKDWTLHDDCLALTADFSGQKFRFSAGHLRKHPFFEVKLGAPPVSDKTTYFFNSDGYSKHLLGNSFSIPVVEYLLHNLREIYDTKVYSYHYRQLFYCIS